MNRRSKRCCSRWYLVISLFLLLLSGFLDAIHAQLVYQQPEMGYGVTVLFEGNWPTIGDAYPHNWWYAPDANTTGAAVYKQFFIDHFVWLSGGGGMVYNDMWIAVPDFTSVDDQVSWGKTNHMHIKLDFLCRANDMSWMETNNLAGRRQQTLDRVEQIVTRYPGVEVWNFANEILIDTYWTNILEWSCAEIVANLSMHAKKFVPQAKIGINHVSVLPYSESRNEYIQLHQDALALGAQLDYIGVEAHMPPQNVTNSIRDIKIALNDLVAQTGIDEIHVTEFDFFTPFDSGLNAWQIDPNVPYEGYTNYWVWQAAAYQRAIDEFRTHPAVKCIIFAGFDDGEMSWNCYAGLLHAIQLADTAINPKTNYWAVLPVLLDAIAAPQALFEMDTSTGAVPVTISFDAARTFSRTGTIVSYNWNFDDGSIGAGSVITHTFTNAGCYDITLTVKDNNGLEDAKTVRIVLQGADHAGPYVESVHAGNTNTITVTFSETVDAVTATNTGNYILDNGVSVTHVALDAKQLTATLDVSSMSYTGHILTLSNIQDTNGNAIAAGTRIYFVPDEVMVFTPEADATVKAAGDSNNNYGSDMTLEARYPWNAYQRRAYLRFDLGSINRKNITSAKLRLFLNAYSNGDSTKTNILLVYNTEDAWDESTITWNNAPPYKNMINTRGDVIAVTNNLWLEVDVTDHVQWHPDAYLSFCLDLYEQEYDTFFMSSREGSNPPQLVLSTARSADKDPMTQPVLAQCTITHEQVSIAVTNLGFAVTNVLERCMDIPSDNWEAVSTFSTISTHINWSHLVTNNDHCAFYRIRAKQ